MNSDLQHEEDGLLEWLVACDEAQASGMSTQPLALLEQSERITRDLACMKVLREALAAEASTAPLDNAPMENSSGPLPFSRLARFQIRRELGHGSCGIVFLAYDPQLRRDVALKVPRGEALITPELRERFLHEARVAAGLDHPNIVSVFEAGAVGPLCYIASTYCPGLALDAWLKTWPDPIPSRDAAILLATLAEAVEHAHRRGILHRDLKPANVLMQSPALGTEATATISPLGNGAPANGNLASLRAATPRITDFGLAKVLLADDAGQTRSGAIVGTPCYMAPEQAAGQNKNVGPAADVYGLGAVLYEVLTGRPPFRGETVLDTLEQVRSNDPVPPSRLRPRLPRDLETICLHCLQKQSDQRYATAGALAAELRRFIAGEPIQARPAGVWERCRKWAKRRPAAASLAFGSVAAGLVTVLCGVGYFAQLHDHQASLAGVLDDARQERAVARGQRDLALESLDKLVFEVQASLRGGPGTQELRKKLLGIALKGLQEVVRDDNSAAADESTAAAYDRLGQIYLELSDLRAAQENFEHARVVAENLMQVDPKNSRARQRLADALRGLGTSVGRQGDALAARSLMRESLDVAESWARDEPGSGAAQLCILCTCNELADAYRDQCDRTAALQSLARAVEVGEPLAAAASADPIARRELAYAHEVRGELHVEKHEFKEARRSFEQTLALRQALVRDTQSSWARVDLGCVLWELGNNALRAKDAAAAKTYLLQSLTLLEAEARANPQWMRAGRMLSLACDQMGETCLQLGEPEAARGHFQRFRQLREELAGNDPRNIILQSEMADCYCKLGWFENATWRPEAAPAWFKRALQHLRQLEAAGMFEGNPKLGTALEAAQLELVDCELVLRAIDDLPFALTQPAEKLPHLLLTRAVVLARRGNVAEAAASLDQAIERGYTNRSQLQADPLLEPLRQLPGYRDSLTKMGKK